MKADTLPKTWFITGASSGFGRTLTEKLVAGGDRVAATRRKVHVLDDLKAQYGDDLWVASLDVPDAEAVRRVVDRAFATMGRKPDLHLGRDRAKERFTLTLAPTAFAGGRIGRFFFLAPFRAGGRNCWFFQLHIANARPPHLFMADAV